MERIEYRDLERSRELPPGPWDDEPDKVQHVIRHTRIRVGPSVQRAPRRHADVAAPLPERSAPDHAREPVRLIRPHGGLSYAAACDGDEEHGICHVPGPGEPEPLWWFGFDCGHAFDLTPGMPMLDSELGRKIRNDQVYRDVDYVTAETVRLAAQIGELA